jgi:hypothetical protein
MSTVFSDGEELPLPAPLTVPTLRKVQSCSAPSTPLITPSLAAPNQPTDEFHSCLRRLYDLASDPNYAPAHLSLAITYYESLLKQYQYQLDQSRQDQERPKTMTAFTALKQTEQQEYDDRLHDAKLETRRLERRVTDLQKELDYSSNHVQELVKLNQEKEEDAIRLKTELLRTMDLAGQTEELYAKLEGMQSELTTVQADLEASELQCKRFKARHDTLMVSHEKLKREHAQVVMERDAACKKMDASALLLAEWKQEREVAKEPTQQPLEEASVRFSQDLAASNLRLQQLIRQQHRLLKDARQGDMCQTCHPEKYASMIDLLMETDQVAGPSKEPKVTSRRRSSSLADEMSMVIDTKVQPDWEQLASPTEGESKRIKRMFKTRKVCLRCSGKVVLPANGAVPEMGSSDDDDDDKVENCEVSWWDLFI